MRQQSKEIAEDVRNKVRTEKKKQLSSIDQKGAENLQKWQARKLLDLHNQYQECLKGIGLGHKDAQVVNHEENNIESQVEKNEVVQEKKQKSTKKSRVNHTESKLKTSVLSHKTKASKDIGIVRPGLISKPNKIKVSPFKCKKNKKKLATITTTVDNLQESDDSEDKIVLNAFPDSIRSDSTVVTKNSKSESHKFVATSLEHLEDSRDLSERFLDIPASDIQINDSVKSPEKAKITDGKICSCL